MATLSDLIPFSVFEISIILIPAGTVIFTFFAVRKFKSGEGVGRFAVDLLSFVLVLYSLRVFAVGIAYNATPLSDRINLAKIEITDESLASTLIRLRNDANELSYGLQKNSDLTVNGELGLEELGKLISESYSALSSEYRLPKGFYSKVKGVHFSDVMSRLSLSGIYSPLTGEVNVNTAYPDFDVAFSAAHEMCHQRGILREDDANLGAYIVLSHSENEFLKYSAALSMYGYVGAALYKTDPKRYFEIADVLSPSAKADLSASNSITVKNKNTALSDLANTVNDISLKTQGTSGRVSYSGVTRLIVSYLAVTNFHNPE